MYKKILLGIDNSYNAIHAVKKAIEIQKRDKCKVVIFHSVLHHLSELNINFSNLNGANGKLELIIHDDFIKRGEDILKEAEKLFKESNVKVETRLIFDTLPENYIKNVVEEEGFDLVILGCKGHHSKLSGVLLGTIPNKVVNNVYSDVLVVR